MKKLNSSPIQNISFKGYDFLIKRDDLLDKDFSGNKARKFYYYLINDFPNIDTIISYGSNQSNAMYSLSILAKLKKWRFIYYVDHIPSHLNNNPSGNYKYALKNGMELKIKDNNFELSKKFLNKNELFISEGGAISEAELGIKQLAFEIKEYIKEKKIKNLKVFLPSGTGTTALFLQKHLDIEVLTTPCVGDSEYLKKQFLELVNDESLYPKIITPFKKFHFGKLYKENYFIWEELNKETSIEFDLLYDPIGWQVLIEYIKKCNQKNIKYLYIHQGGLLGNETMLERYHRKLSLSESIVK